MVTFDNSLAMLAVDVLVRTTLVMGAAYGITCLLRPRATVRHAILLAGLASVCVLPLAAAVLGVFELPRWSLAILTQSGPVKVLTSEAAVEIGFVSATPRPAAVASRPLHLSDSLADRSGPTPILSHASRQNDWALATRGWSILPTLLGVVWVLGAVAKLTGLSAALVRLRRIVARARPAEPQPSPSVMVRVQRRVGLQSVPLVLESAEIFTPTAAGVAGNYVLLPVGCAASLSPTELFPVLCHEGGHLARRDHRVVVLQEVVASILWFHPLVHLINGALNQAREEICDNFALGAVDRPDYCALLYRLADELSGRSLLGATSMSSRRWPLEERIRGILDERRPTMTTISNSARWTIATIALTCCGFAAIPQLTNSAQETPAAPPKADDAAESTEEDSGEKLDLGTLTDVRDVPDAVQKLRVNMVNADVTVSASEEPELQIEANVTFDDIDRYAEAPGREFKDHVKVEIDDETLLIEEVPLPDGVKAVRHLVVSIALPRAMPLTVRTVDGDISITYAEVDLDIVATDGDIVVEAEATGKLTAKTVDGDISVTANVIGGAFTADSIDGDIVVDVGEIQGIATVAASDGDITFEFRPGDAAAAAESVTVRTSDGDVQLQFGGAGVKKELSALTADGDILMKASRRVQADLALMTADGEIEVDDEAVRPKSLSSGGAKMTAGRLGDGGAPFALKSAGGDIRVEVER